MDPRARSPFVQLTFELVRVRTDGPIVDGIALGEPLQPHRCRRRSTASPPSVRTRHPVRIVVLAPSTTAALLLGAGLRRPATTEAIIGADGEPIAGSIAEIVEVPIGGHDQAIMRRGVSAEAPVLLFLEGGPGWDRDRPHSQLGRCRGRRFHRRHMGSAGTGNSYDALEPTSTVTVDQMVTDTIEVTDYVRARFDEQKVYLVGSPGERSSARGRAAYHGTYALFIHFATEMAGILGLISRARDGDIARSFA